MREKASRTAEQLVLTGTDARIIISAKTDLIEWCARGHLAGIPIILMAYVVSPRDLVMAPFEIPTLFAAVWCLPRGIGMVGMVFSLVAKSPARALAAMLTAPVLLVLLATLTVSGVILVGPAVIVLGAAAILVALFLSRRSGKWTVQRLSAVLVSHLLFALLVAACFSGILGAFFVWLFFSMSALLPPALGPVAVASASIVLVVCTTTAVGGIILQHLWFALGVDLFDSYMLDTDTKGLRRTAYW